jgi:hypothetical protein
MRPCYEMGGKQDLLKYTFKGPEKLYRFIYILATAWIPSAHVNNLLPWQI